MKRLHIRLLVQSVVVLGVVFSTNVLFTTSASAENVSKVEAPFLAFRPITKLPAEDWKALTTELKQSGISFLQDDSLNYHQILVFQLPLGTATLETLEILLSEMIQVPVTGYKDRYGVISSVSTGYFFLQFVDSITMEEARHRLEDAGFTITSPVLEPRSLIVVEGTRFPEDQAKELARLKALSDLLYVSPDTIPLRH